MSARHLASLASAPNFLDPGRAEALRPNVDSLSRGGSPHHERTTRDAGRAARRPAPRRASGSNRVLLETRRRRSKTAIAQPMSASFGCSKPDHKSVTCKAGQRASAGSRGPKTALRRQMPVGTRAGLPQRRDGLKVLVPTFTDKMQLPGEKTPHRQR
jgi:hypothetical protein